MGEVYQNHFEELNEEIETETIYKGKTSNLKFKKGKNLSIGTDVYGSGQEFLQKGYNDGLFEIKQGKTPIIFIDSKGNTYNNYSDYTGAEILTPIFNLEIHGSSKTKSINLGDYIDRGQESEIIINTLKHFNREMKEKGILMQGNHEIMFLHGYTYNTYNHKGIVDKSNSEQTEEAIKQIDMQFCHASGNTIFSHTVFERNHVILALNILLKDKNAIKKQKDDYFKDLDWSEKDIDNFFDKNANFNVDVEKVKKLREKLEKNKEPLNEKEIQLMASLLNQLNNYYYKNNLDKIQKEDPKNRMLDPVFMGRANNGVS